MNILYFIALLGLGYYIRPYLDVFIKIIKNSLNK